MDLSFITGKSEFNYRACGVITDRGRLLAMLDSASPYYYLPGGRVRLGETAEHAVAREIEEELGVSLPIIRPLWLNQGFFHEEVQDLDFHELCVYFLMDAKCSELLRRGESFDRVENGVRHSFRWLAFDALREMNVVPHFIKEAIFALPESFTLIASYD